MSPCDNCKDKAKCENIKDFNKKENKIIEKLAVPEKDNLFDFYEEDKSPKELFEKSGYKQLQNDNYWTIYESSYKDISFNLLNKNIEISGSRLIYPDELKAMYKQAIEKGWIV